MSKYRVFPQRSGWNRSKVINLLMEEIFNGHYETIKFDGQITDVDTIEATGASIDSSIKEFLEEEEAIGFQFVPFSTGQFCIHVLYYERDKDADYNTAFYPG